MMRLLLAALVAVCVSAAPKDDLIEYVPGLDYHVNFRSYSGYLKASGTNKLHYWFVESQGDVASDPLVLWLNGGPGCSSMEGLLKENGPYLVNSDGKTLRDNPFSWNKIANVLYLESPAGVGYSYNDEETYMSNDDTTANDNYLALKSFFALYPEYEGRDFYVTGESYGGVYVPTLSVKLLSDSSINFKGAAIGNGALNFRYLDNSIIAFAYGHGLIGTVLMENLIKSCCKSGTNDCNYYDNPSSTCNKYVSEARQSFASLNIYNMYEECYPSDDVRRDDFLFTKNPYVHPKLNSTTLKLGNVGGSPPCVNSSDLATYMNSAKVQYALHVKSGIKWTVCSNVLSYQRTYDDMTKQVQQIIAAKKRVLVYNGDVDMACNFLGDEWFVDSLNQPISVPRTPWNYKAEDGSTQNGGYVKQFDGIAFLTVRGSGHMVPQDKPRPAFKMFEKFIKNERYDK